MRMFEPGHLHITRTKLQEKDFGYNFHVRYEVNQNPSEGACMLFAMEGEINGKAFKEEFELTKDKAYNFASDAFHLAVKHGMPKGVDIRQLHGEYDQMFEDIRAKLDMKSGDPVKPEHLK
jgi:hypothetical protein